MKKFLSLLTGLFLLLVLSGNGYATPVQIGTGGSLALNGFGLAVADYDVNAFGPFDLDVGESTGILDLFTINHALGFGLGQTLTANIELASPGVTATDDGTISFIAAFGLSATKLVWGDPIDVAYGNGGLLTLDMVDITGRFFGGEVNCLPFPIQGSITNKQNPVPEPATMLLFGLGLLGLAGVNRRKK